MLFGIFVNNTVQVKALPKIGFLEKQQTLDQSILQVINDAAFSQDSMKYYFVCKLYAHLKSNADF